MTRIVEIMEKRGIDNLNQLAKKAGIDSQSLYAIVDGRTKNPTFNTLKDVADVLNVTVGQLMGTESLPGDAKPTTGIAV